MPTLPSLAEIQEAAESINRVVRPTPQFSWPLLNARVGCELWVKHENHTAIGSFKIRGALHYVGQLVKREPKVKGLVAATRGNFGQAVAFAARRYGLSVTIVVPKQNSPSKNQAMLGLGAELIEHGDDFQAALLQSERIAVQQGLHWIPSFHRDLVVGIAVSTLDFMTLAPAMERVYVPIGLGSGICAMIAARDALGLTTRIVGVASEQAPAIALSFERRVLITHPASTRIADGMACSTPVSQALDPILNAVEKIVTVSDDEVEKAMRAYFSDTHNVAEGAAGAALAAVMKERASNNGCRVGVVLTGGNVDTETFGKILLGT